MNEQIDAGSDDIRSSVQDYLLPQAFTKRSWSLFAFIRIHKETNDPRPEKFTEFLRQLIGESGKGLELQLDWWEQQTEAGDLDANVFFRQGLLGVLAHEFVRINLLSLASKNYAGDEKYRFKLLKNRLDTESQIANGDTDALANVNPGKLIKGTAKPKITLDAVDLAFTHSGLTTLGIDQNTLDSFPEAFRQGMAARTHLTGDGPADAPETWEGSLGQDCVHALLTMHFPVDEKRLCFWDNLDQEVALFNRDAWQWPACDSSSAHRGSSGSKEDALTSQIELAEHAFGWHLPDEKKNELISHRAHGLRDVVSKFTEYLGFEFLHFELGQIPYELEESSAAADTATNTGITSTGDRNNRTIKPARYRREHFGFREMESASHFSISKAVLRHRVVVRRCQMAAGNRWHQERYSWARKMKTSNALCNPSTIRCLSMVLTWYSENWSKTLQRSVLFSRSNINKKKTKTDSPRKWLGAGLMAHHWFASHTRMPTSAMNQNRQNSMTFAISQKIRTGSVVR